MIKYKPDTTEGKCPFCEISKRNMETPGIFWEDEDFMAFLSLWPNTEGFSVVITKDHYNSDVLKLPEKVLCNFIIAAKRVSDILIEHFKDVGRVGLIMEGTGIDHAHVKLFPMHGTKYLKEGKWKQHPSGIDKYFAFYEGYISSNDGPKADEGQIRDLAKSLKEIQK